MIASQLSERARRQTREANLRKQEVERLYTLSQQLLVSENVVDLLKFIPRYVTETFGVDHAALYVAARDQSYRSDAERQELPAAQLKDAIGNSRARLTLRGDFSLHETDQEPDILVGNRPGPAVPLQQFGQVIPRGNVVWFSHDDYFGVRSQKSNRRSHLNWK